MKDVFLRMLYVGVGGFLGANARYFLGVWIQQHVNGFPAGTLVINITGSFVLGFMVTLGQLLVWDRRWTLLIPIGFIGAYTTFSTFENDSLGLVSDGEWLRLGGYVVGSVLGGFLAVYLGRVCALLLLGRTV
ncbi:camphor resistance protein CrcB [Chthonomonas calidirosea]|uniref:Fluoride-specific ion channel FluC n=1 Tax=Chthonomonas calidirosea (strain DSM 23976 / ICMP 18418 / T49) TaxID=1303518 RepID=S0EVW8_CHTCT|nr:fluoride efflux transporter CrcB [Chthonomonas calidirosea]CCW35965.1 camphor resistance protein CrcB [Chthonomonas calidirosea T49]CEK17693.1 camphor resistance protein CrcB [Chthonomonas calidirosea]CEK17694.1 camphor resistance protein CrcB [Chthonomonas calidirosea]CEK18725.1 camphor resistance protein CrcB [Chthonomonas calidirosea]